MALLVSIMDLKSTAALQHAADELHLTMCRPTNYVLKEAYGLVSLIPYDPLSKTRIGKALKAKSNDLFYAWVKYCVLNPSFSYSKVAAMYEEWCGWDNHAVGCYESVVMARAEAENKIMFDAVLAATVQSIVQPILLMVDSEADYSLAVLLHCIYRRKFVCTSLRNNTWYMYEGAKWQEADAGCLRRHLSETIYQLFLDKLTLIISLVPTIKSEQEYQKRQVQRISYHMIALKNQKRKELIMRHATALFYDPSFDPELTPAK
jgi:hypothetical protein